MKFEMPIAELITLNVVDIITTSTEDYDPTNGGDFGTPGEEEF